MFSTKGSNFNMPCVFFRRTPNDNINFETFTLYDEMVIEECNVEGNLADPHES